ncbi:MAG: ABC transporter substrate-binding protein [Bryobacterales bacterium]|nr:ABC transporter substrate-binding protein [Bryobacterales bacterium]
MKRTLLILAVLAPWLAGQGPPDRLVLGQRTEPRSFNPVTAADEPSRQIAGLFHASLLRSNPATRRLEPALAESWRAHRNGLEWTATLRRGLRFSDGRALTAADVAFSYEVYLDERLAAPQREALLVEGKPVEVRALDERTVRLRLPGRSALGERMLEAIPVLPRHLLEEPFREGRLPAVWTASTRPAAMAGAGPFRLQQYEPGQRLIAGRNPHYWSAGEPHLRELEFVFAATEDSLLARYLAGELDLLAGFGPGAFDALARGANSGERAVQDLGPSLDYTFLLFNLNPGAAAAKPGLRDARFRRAVSRAIDREAIVRLAYRGHATPLWGHVTPARQDWFDPKLPRPARSLEAARGALREGGYRWDGQGRLLTPNGAAVTFTVASSASNPVYGQIAAVIQEDLRQLGMQVNAVALEFRSLIDRVTAKKDFDTAVMALRPGEADPAADLNVLLSTGPTHLWNLGGEPAAWERALDGWLRRVMSATDRKQRVAAFQEVQKILAVELPFIALASPNILVASRPGLQGVSAVPGGHPALSNAPKIRWTEGADANRGK